MRNFEDIANEKKSQEKSHMVQIENEKNFYKKIMHTNMQKELEVEKSMKKLTIYDKDQAEKARWNKKQNEDADDITEWTVSRPETREFGSANVKKREPPKKTKVKQFKTTSIYLSNTHNINTKNSDFDFSKPLFDSNQNDGFKFIDMNLFRYKKVEEKPIDYDMYMDNKKEELGHNYLKEY